MRFDVRGGDVGVGLEQAANLRGVEEVSERERGEEKRGRTSGVMYSEMSSDQALESMRSLLAWVYQG